MATQNTKIEWTEATWNPVRGCSKISVGCQYCYAERFAERWRGVKGHPYERGFDLRLVPKALKVPLEWKRPRMIFVNSMSDLFHEEVPLHFIQRVFETMGRAQQHTFQILTKRSERLRELADSLTWYSNIWMGVSIECPDYLFRIHHLRHVPATVRFISLEPLLAPLRVPFAGIDWVIVGGESGPKARPINPIWVRRMRDACVSASVPFFFKQWGGVRPKRTGRVIDGRTWSQYPKHHNQSYSIDSV